MNLALAVAAALLVLTFVTLKVMQLYSATNDEHPGDARHPPRWIDPILYGSAAAAPTTLLRRGAVHEPTLVTASEGDRQRAGHWQPFFAKPGPTGDRPTLERLLRETQGPLALNRPVWPVCCERLGTLIAHHCSPPQLRAFEVRAGPLDMAYLEGELATWAAEETERARLLRIGWSAVLADLRAGKSAGQGIAIYRCDNCGCVYVASCGP